MWKLPMFGETDVNKVLAEAEACHKANPDNHVRLIGYNNFNQSQGASMVILPRQDSLSRGGDNLRRPLPPKGDGAFSS
ncbi:MAG: ribulose bisphosphate carboxylase small subunit [Comamonadaceae bacterium]|nr:ribulose bisphosphate carboxylase small subunit [Comamonadaceae bacterium]